MGSAATLCADLSVWDRSCQLSAAHEEDVWFTARLEIMLRGMNEVVAYEPFRVRSDLRVLSWHKVHFRLALSHPQV
jgi:hypothetical protein